MQSESNHKIDTSKRKSGFEYFTEIIGWIQIMLSPLLIGIIFGAIIYFLYPSKAALVFTIVIAIIGLLIGIIWASKVWKTKGTSYFMSEIMSTPELDPKDEE